MIIRGILVTTLAPFEDHMANCGEKLLGNASSIKRRPDGKVYVSGQMQRHVLFSAIDRLNQWDTNKEQTFVSNGDGVSNQIENDLRADMGGFMHPVKGDYSGRRTAPLSVTPAVAMKESEVGRDLLTRVKMSSSAESNDQALATREYSEYDMMLMKFFLDVTSVGVSKTFEYEGGFNVSTNYIKHISDEEKMRRVKLYLKGTSMMNDYANQARNAVCGEPQQVLIVFDPILSRKACRYFTAGDIEKKNILKELDCRGAKYFIGNDTVEGMSVAEAYAEALKFLESQENTLCDMAGDVKPQTFEEAFGDK